MNDNHLQTRMSILSWNVHDITDKILGHKTISEEFCQVLKQGLIFCLQETKTEVQLPEYLCFNKLRPKSRSGGLCIGVHRSISHNVQRVPCEHEDILAVSIPSSVTRLAKDVVLINVYDSPPNSSYKCKQAAAGEDVNVIDQLINFTAELENRAIILSGDFNARTGELNTEIIHDPSENFGPRAHQSRPSYINTRVSKDAILNERGRKLLEMLESCNLTILNGSTIGDVTGELTSYQYNGASVVDYIATSPDVLDNVDNFRVISLTQFSDHRPLICTLKHNCFQYSSETLVQKYQDIPESVKWNSEISGKTFQDAQDSPGFQNKISEMLLQECHTAEDVIKLNLDITSTLVEIGKMSGKEPRPSSRSKRKMKSKNKWFDASCIFLKRDLRSLTKRYSKDPTNSSLRLRYYSKKKEYRSHIKMKKYLYFKGINEEILQGRNISWTDFRKLRNATRAEPKLDLFDIETFYAFFSQLYKKRDLSVDESKMSGSSSTDMSNMSLLLQQILNKDISPDEVKEGIKGLRNGKAAGEDLILNEFLKNTKETTLSVLTRLFNECLKFEVYPWNTTLITPLHKKGCPHDPDNYRAIAVGSNIGKLFSSILLNRLLEFRTAHCPDTPNQRGFCKGAQTSDHIFSLNTCIEKYVKKQRKRLYSCFVDFQKAFDTVSREALLYKLGQLGIGGRFFNCLKHMYVNSSAKLKMVKKLSECFDIKAGTEQGHPLSPELFKCYIHELSKRLNSIDGIESPLLNKVNVTHLLWADDLVLLALNRDSLQMMINELYSFCAEWGLKVNIKKTAVLVFNASGRKLLESESLVYGNMVIPSVREYCYLGTTFSISGSMKANQAQLRMKGLRAYFSLKSAIDLSSIDKAAILKLFDSLILPVISYGCQVWLPRTQLMKCLADNTKKADKEILSAIAQDPMENLHLSLLKWTLGVRKRTANIPIWGDTGRCPIGMEMTKLLVDFLNRLVLLDTADSPQIVRHAFIEQFNLGLDWYTSTKMLCEKFDPNAFSHQRNGTNHLKPNSLLIKNRIKEWFKTKWNSARRTSSKLTFYNLIKDELCYEPYLQLRDHKKAKTLAWLRTSSHRLNVETGRYGTRNTSIHRRVCDFCSSGDKDTLELLFNLPTTQPIIENEEHFLADCPKYQQLRDDRGMELRELLRVKNFREMFNERYILETSNFVFKLFKMRFDIT